MLWNIWSRCARSGRAGAGWFTLKLAAHNLFPDALLLQQEMARQRLHIVSGRYLRSKQSIDQSPPVRHFEAALTPDPSSDGTVLEYPVHKCCLSLFRWRRRPGSTKPSKKAPTDLHATFSNSTAKRILNFRLHARDYMLRIWMEMISISAAQFAVGSPELLIDRSCSAASASEAFDRASQKSQIALAVDSG